MGKRKATLLAAHAVFGGTVFSSRALADIRQNVVAGDHFKPRPADSRGALNQEVSADAHAVKLLDAGGFRFTPMIAVDLRSNPS